MSDIVICNHAKEGRCECEHRQPHAPIHFVVFGGYSCDGEEIPCDTAHDEQHEHWGVKCVSVGAQEVEP